MGAIVTLSLLGVLILYLGLFKARNLLLPVSLLGLVVAAGFLIWSPADKAIPQFQGMILFDDFAIIFSTICILLTGLVFLQSYDYFKTAKKNVAEYYSLLIFSLVGAVMVCSYHNFAMLFVGIEIMSVALYILVGIRKQDVLSNEASLKYFIMGAFSTGFLLFGIALLYGSVGSFDLAVLSSFVLDYSGNIPPMFYMGVLLILTGLCFKVGAAPFHFWTPDVYDGAPTLITIFMSTVVKIASFAAFFRLFSEVLIPVESFWTPVLLAIVIITLFVGNISALKQSSFKKMMAYSSVSHAGYMLFAILVIGHAAASGLLIYSIAYAFASIVAFGGLYLVKREVGSEQFEAFNGLAKKNPVFALIMTIAMLSLAGIPLTAGFMGKFMLFTNVMETSQVVLIALAAINAAIGVVYYLRVVIHMYFKAAETPKMEYSFSYNIVLILCVIGTLLLGIYPGVISVLL